MLPSAALEATYSELATGIFHLWTDVRVSVASEKI